MKNTFRLFLFIIPSLIFGYGCKSLDRSLIYHYRSKIIKKDWRKIVRNNPLAPGQKIKVISLDSSANASYHLVQIRDREEPHLHETHDLIVLVKQGRGIVHLENKSFKLKQGSIIVIPQGTAHYYENKCDCISVAFTIFIPPFKGKDIKKLSSFPEGWKRENNKYV